MVWPGADGMPLPETPALKKRWYRPRLWWSIPGAVIVIGAVAGIIITGAPKSKPPDAAQTSSSRAGDSGTSSNTGSGAVGTGYLASGSGQVIFIQWTMSGDSLNGSAQVDTLEGTPPNASVSTNTIPVSGSISGTTITLSFNGETEVFGTLAGGSFTVNFPQTNGSLAPVAFTSATATQFNYALAQLQGGTGSANQSAAAAQAIAKEQATISSDASGVAGDISGLSSDVGTMNSDLGQFSQTLALAKSDLAIVAGQEQMVQGEAQGGTEAGQVCADAGTADADAGTVDADAGSVSADGGTTKTDVNTVRSDISGLQSDFAAYQSAQAQEPSYKVNAPTQAAVNQAIAGAQAAISAAVNSANAAITQVNAYVSQAYSDAQGADNDGNCGSVSPPQPQPAIS